MTGVQTCALPIYNGIVLTNLYGNDGSNIYLKEITNGQTKVDLSKQEDEALKRAKGMES